jgi:3-oxoacyl-[acyl-carrier protein] reductase
VSPEQPRSPWLTPLLESSLKQQLATTEFWAELTPEARQQRVDRTLVGREGTPDEVASLAAWLIRPDGGWMTGQILSPNGGAVLGR